MKVVQKDAEYQRFIAMVEGNKIPGTWEMLAEALGVHRNTITQWRKLPEFQQAKIKGVEHALKMMEVSGEKDWKMWREKVGMLTNEKKPDVQVNMQVNFLDYVERDTPALAEDNNKR
jgi:Fe-S cluster biosynthesis and repair protein YggX